MSALTFFALFYLFFNDTPVSGGFWQLVLNIIEFLRVEPGLVGEGIDLFYFWR